MNTNFRSLWNASIGAWVAVSETARSCGKRSGSVAKSGGAGAAVLLAAAFFGSATPAWATCSVTAGVMTCSGVNDSTIALSINTELVNTGDIGRPDNGSTPAVFAFVANAKVTNSGNLRGGYGVLFYESGSTFLNQGGRVSADYNGIQAQDVGTTVVNAGGGSILAVGSAVDLQGGSVSNTGGSTIGSSTGYGVVSRGSPLSLTNEAGSTIYGATAAISALDYATTLNNAGQINGKRHAGRQQRQHRHAVARWADRGQPVHRQRGGLDAHAGRQRHRHGSSTRRR